MRFIAQPYAPQLSPADNLTYARQVAASFLSARVTRKATGFLERVLEIFPHAGDPIPPGNFFLWLGLGLEASGAPIAKLYLNPWAALPTYRGTPGLIHLLLNSGVDKTALEHVRVVVGHLQVIPHIIGFNIPVEGGLATKVYLAGRLAKHRLIEYAGSTSDQNPEARASPLREVLRAVGADEGEVHLSLSFAAPEAPPEIRVNLFCGDWFPDDQALINATRCLGQSSLTDALETLRSSSPSRRRFNFLGLSPGNATLYFKLTPIA